MTREEELKTLCNSVVKNTKDISYQLFMFNPYYFNLLLFQDNKFIVGIDGNFYQVKNFLQNKLDRIKGR
jgi:hypothetical protein